MSFDEREFRGEKSRSTMHNCLNSLDQKLPQKNPKKAIEK
jgi:hypothetical protein